MTGFDQDLPEVLSVRVPHLMDGRGALTKIFFEGAFGAAGIDMVPRQILHSLTERPWTLRGLHAQQRPHSEGKIIVSLSGRMFWVLVDLRGGSASFGRWAGFDLHADESGASLLQVPAGFAHGCLSLTDHVSLLILADRDHAPGQGIGIAWNDPSLAIDWPLSGHQPFLSDEHASYGSFARFVEHHQSL